MLLTSAHFVAPASGSCRPRASACRASAQARIVCSVGAPAQSGAGAATGTVTPGLVLVGAGACSPHPEKRTTGGEDAHLVLPLKTGGVLAVADGVGGWKDYGIDAGLYSRRLLQNTADALMTAEGATDPKAALAKAHEATVIPGAATACVVVLDGAQRPSQKLKAINVGDSGFKIFRNGDWVFASEFQEHEFDCPFQLGHPKYVPNTDYPDAGKQYEQAVAPGDIIILASDGVYDNLRPEQLKELILEATKKAGSAAGAYDRAKAVAEAIVAKARECASDSGYLSPYIEEAAKVGKIKNPLGAFAKTVGLTPKGGKEDDVTVVAAVVADGAQEGALAQVQRAFEAASANAASIPSAVGDAGMEKRDVWLYLGEEKKTTRREEAEAVAAEVATGQRKSMFSAAEIAQMDASLLRTNLMKLGLPTSGKLEALRKRLSEVPAKE